MIDQSKYKAWTSAELYCGVCSGPFAKSSIEVFTKYPQCKNANIANFDLSMPLEVNKTRQTNDNTSFR